jgi:hypothetical protein
MNLHARFFTGAALLALAASATPLASQTTEPTGGDVAPISIVAVPAPAAGTQAPSLNGPPAPSVDASAQTTARGPRVTSARVASHATSAPIGAAPVIQNRPSNRNAVALMAVGGAALVVGAVIGDDAGTLVMLGGAVVGLYGLYLFLT